MEMNEIQKLFEENQCRELAWTGHCHDCHEKTTVIAHVKDDGELQITGGAVYSDGAYHIKCEKCFDLNPVLDYYKPVDAYSRVVGYLQPIRQWNPGKQAEFNLRATFDKATVG